MLCHNVTFKWYLNENTHVFAHTWFYDAMSNVHYIHNMMFKPNNIRMSQYVLLNQNSYAWIVLGRVTLK